MKNGESRSKNCNVEVYGGGRGMYAYHKTCIIPSLLGLS